MNGPVIHSLLVHSLSTQCPLTESSARRTIMITVLTVHTSNDATQNVAVRPCRPKGTCWVNGTAFSAPPNAPFVDTLLATGHTVLAAVLAAVLLLLALPLALPLAKAATAAPKEQSTNTNGISYSVRSQLVKNMLYVGATFRYPWYTECKYVGSDHSEFSTILK